VGKPSLAHFAIFDKDELLLFPEMGLFNNALYLHQFLQAAVIGTRLSILVALLCAFTGGALLYTNP
tara:strand:- start:7 stop:204 length:198 start_codon:yes stop_codon:yes gene_type:complete